MARPGHFQSLAGQENRVANDRFQSTAVIARRELSVTSSSKRSLVAYRCRSTSRADRLTAGHGLEMELPTHTSPSVRSKAALRSRQTTMFCPPPSTTLSGRTTRRDSQRLRRQEVRREARATQGQRRSVKAAEIRAPPAATRRSHRWSSHGHTTFRREVVPRCRPTFRAFPRSAASPPSCEPHARCSG